MIRKFDIKIVYHGDGGLAMDFCSIIEQAKDVAFRAFEILDSLSPKSGRLSTSPKGCDACGV